MTARLRLLLVAGVALVLAGPVRLFFLGRLVLGNDALLLDHVTERRTPLVELSLGAGADPNYRDEDGSSALPDTAQLYQERSAICEYSNDRNAACGPGNILDS